MTRFAILLIVIATTPACAANRVRVAVLGLFHPKQILVETLPATPMLVKSGREQIVIGTDAPERIAVTLSSGRLTVRVQGTLLAARRMSFSARDGGDSELFLCVPGKLRRRYRGKLVIIAAGNELVPVVEMDLETVVASVVAAELPSDAPLEAMKAQAVVSRSFLAAGGPRHRDADFCDTTHCQFLREPPAAKSRATIATRETEGLVLAWKGKSFPAMFSASCGGRTHSLAQVGYAAIDYPYFSVKCPYCHRAPDRWSLQLSEKEAALMENNRRSTAAGRKLSYHGIESNTYRLTKTTRSFELNGVGRGHGFGLCQRGAIGMAHSGKDFRTILNYYFPNTTTTAL